MTSSSFDPFADLSTVFNASSAPRPSIMTNSSQTESTSPVPAPKPPVMNQNVMVPVQAPYTNQWASQVGPMSGSGMMQQQQKGQAMIYYGQQQYQQPIASNGYEMQQQQYYNMQQSFPSPPVNASDGSSTFGVSPGPIYQNQQFLSPSQSNSFQSNTMMSPNMNLGATFGISGSTSASSGEHGNNVFASIQPRLSMSPVPPPVSHTPMHQSLVPHQHPNDHYAVSAAVPDSFGSPYGTPADPKFVSPGGQFPETNPFDTYAPAASQQQIAPSANGSSALSKDDAEDDFFGEFSNTFDKSHDEPVESPSFTSPAHPPSELEGTNDDDVSQFTRSVASAVSNRPPISGKTAFDDPKFAPKPPKPHGLENSLSLAQKAPFGSSQLPNWELITHSGYVLSRISFRTILIKKWKQTFWVSYGTSKILFFRSKADFEDWVSNPYLTTAEREFLVKLTVDFIQDAFKPGVNGYQVTPQKLKGYNNEMLHQFKLERWMDYGPTIAAAFASHNEMEVFNLRTIIVDMLRRSPQPHTNRVVGMDPPGIYANQSNDAQYPGQVRTHGSVQNYIQSPSYGPSIHTNTSYRHSSSFSPSDRENSLGVQPRNSFGQYSSGSGEMAHVNGHYTGQRY